MLALHDRGLHAELRGADGRDVAAGAAAEHDRGRKSAQPWSLLSAPARPGPRRQSLHVPVLIGGGADALGRNRSPAGSSSSTRHSMRRHRSPRAARPDGGTARRPMPRPRWAGSTNRSSRNRSQPAGEGAEGVDTTAPCPTAAPSASASIGMRDGPGRTALPEVGFGRCRHLVQQPLVLGEAAHQAQRCRAHIRRDRARRSDEAATDHSIRLSGSSTIALNARQPFRPERAVHHAVIDATACRSSPWPPPARRPCTTGRCCPAATARIAACGGLMIGGELAARRTSPCWRSRSRRPGTPPASACRPARARPGPSSRC